MDIVTVFERFPTQKSCIEHLGQSRWSGAPRCPYCTRQLRTLAAPPPLLYLQDILFGDSWNHLSPHPPATSKVVSSNRLDAERPQIAVRPATLP